MFLLKFGNFMFLISIYFLLNYIYIYIYIYIYLCKTFIEIKNLYI